MTNIDIDAGASIWAIRLWRWPLGPDRRRAIILKAPDRRQHTFLISPSTAADLANRGIQDQGKPSRFAAYLPEHSRCAVAQALTRWSGGSAPAPEPRNVLPSVATCLMAKVFWRVPAPTPEACLERLRIESVAHPFKGAMSGDAVRQFQKTFQPVATLAAKGFNLCQSWAPAIVAQRAMTMMSCKRCRRRGSFRCLSAGRLTRQGLGGVKWEGCGHDLLREAVQSRRIVGSCP